MNRITVAVACFFLVFAACGPAPVSVSTPAGPEEKDHTSATSSERATHAPAPVHTTEVAVHGF